MTEPMLSAQQVADLLGMSASHVYRLKDKPDGIPAYRVGGRRLRFYRDEVEQYIRRQAVKPAQHPEPAVSLRFRYVPGMKVV